jgi:hypothetical protein
MQSDFSVGQTRRRSLVLQASLLPLVGLLGVAHLRWGQVSQGVVRIVVGLGDLVALVLFHSTGAAGNLIFDEDSGGVLYLMVVGAGVGIYLWLWIEGVVFAVRGPTPSEEES